MRFVGIFLLVLELSIYLVYTNWFPMVFSEGIQVPVPEGYVELSTDQTLKLYCSTELAVYTTGNIVWVRCGVGDR